MRIAFVSTYPPIECGIGTYTQFLSDAMRFQKKEIHILSQQGAKGANVHAVYNPHSDSIAKDIFLTAARISPDVVHIEHEFGLFGDQRGVQVMELVLRLKMAGIPCITTLHTVNDKMDYDEKIIVENLVRESDKVIVHETYQKEILLNRFHLKDNIYVVPHGIRHVEKVPNAKKCLGIEDKKVILLAGYFRVTKNFDRIVKIFPKIVRQVPDACLLIAGKLRGIEYSGYQKEFFELINQSPVRDKMVVLRGQFPQHTFDTILSAADVMAFPYNVGAQSGVMAHSAAFHIPVVTSDLKSFVQWNLECKGGKTAKTDADFIRMLTKLLNDNKKREIFQDNIKAFIKPRLWDSIAKKHFEIYESVIRVPYGEARFFYIPES